MNPLTHTETINFIHKIEETRYSIIAIIREIIDQDSGDHLLQVEIVQIIDPTGQLIAPKTLLAVAFRQLVQNAQSQYFNQ